MRVLLVAPTDPTVPGDLRFLMGGENTYTKTLLVHPPAGVTYVHHLEALQNREVRLGPYHRPLRMLTKLRVLPLSAGTFDLVIEGEFDLVHCHAYTLRLSGRGARNLPVILGDSIPNRWTVERYFGYGPLRTAVTYGLRRIVHSTLGVCDQDLTLGDFVRLVVMSQFAKTEHLRFGAGAKRIEVVYPALPDRIASQRLDSKRRRAVVGDEDAVNLLFAGVWFERKGGLVLWEAYQRLRERFGRQVRLTILGPLPDKLKASFGRTQDEQRVKLKVMEVAQHDYVSYDRLVGEFYPNADVLVHVPPRAEGYGLVVEEAMSFGIPAVVSLVGALPEMVVDGETGLVVEPGSVAALTAALEQLVEDRALCRRLGRAARQRFIKFFSLPVMHRRLLAMYREALRERLR